MFGGYGRYMEQYNKAKSGNLSQVEVTEEEFVRLMVADGKTEKEAKFQANMCKMLGSSVMIGEQMVTIKEEKK